MVMIEACTLPLTQAGYPALILASGEGHVNVVKALLTAGANKNRAVLISVGLRHEIPIYDAMLIIQDPDQVCHSDNWAATGAVLYGFMYARYRELAICMYSCLFPRCPCSLCHSLAGRPSSQPATVTT